MAQVIITLKIMPESPETDLDALQAKIIQKITDFSGETETRTSQEPIAFGLKALKIIFVSEESKGSVDVLEDQIRSLEGVQSVEITDVRRAIG
jgi:elongation factor 1-beta